MSKYINIILLSLFGMLGIKHNLGLTLFIPFIYYYTYKNYKNLLMIIPLSFFSIFLFDIHNYIIFILIFIPLIILFWIKENKALYIIITSIITNILSIYIYNLLNDIQGNIYLDILYITLSTLIILYLLNNNKISNYINNDLLLGIALTISCGNYLIYGLSISLILGIYFSMYYSSNNKIVQSIMYSIIISILLNLIFNIDNTYLIIITSLIYIIPNTLSSIIYVLLCIYTYLIYRQLLDIKIYIMLIIIAILFEIFRKHLSIKIEKNSIIDNLYISDAKQIDVELDSFSLFLDKINNDIDESKYSDDINKRIEKLVNEFCFKCERRNECFKNNKGKLYYFFKTCILGSETNFICEHGDNVRRYGRNLGNNLIDKNTYSTDLLKPLLNGISSILKQYKVSKNETKDIDIKKILNLKQTLLDSGYSVSVFNVIKNNEDDFIIEIGFIGISYINEKKQLEKICDKCLDIKTTVNKHYMKSNKTYVLVIPKNNYEITYGYGSVSKVGNSICGDNYLVKNMSNKKLVAIICDGMGKGINANAISSNTITLLDEITNTNMNSETCLHILNTLYYIQDYKENFTTIDFIEIDKHTGEMLIYKAGAALTYIIHNDNSIEKIENEGLPFGLNEIVISKKVKLQNNDLVLLASDGIFDNIIDIKDFEEFILSIKHIEPQKIAYEILNYSRKTDLISKDDMSIIALKIKIV